MDNNSKIRDLKLELEKITVKFISRGLDIKLLHAHVRCEAAHLELIIRVSIIWKLFSSLDRWCILVYRKRVLKDFWLRWEKGLDNSIFNFFFKFLIGAQGGVQIFLYIHDSFSG